MNKHAQAEATHGLDNRIQQVLIRQGGIRLAILFGSLAKGRATPESDLDLAVLMDVPLSAETKMALIGDRCHTRKSREMTLNARIRTVDPSNEKRLALKSRTVTSAENGQ